METQNPNLGLVKAEERAVNCSRSSCAFGLLSWAILPSDLPLLCLRLRSPIAGLGLEACLDEAEGD